MFKIYQIHEMGGEREDRFDNIVGSYVRPERAEAELEKLIDAEKDRMTCYLIQPEYETFEPIYYKIHKVEVEE